MIDESLVGHGDGGEMIHSAKDEVNIANDPGMWLDFSADDVLIGLLVDPVTVNNIMVI